MYYKLLSRKITLGNRTKIFDDDNYKIYWEGFLFIKNLAPGVESLKKFIEELKKSTIHDTCYILSGIFACFIHDIKQNIIYSFSDNSGNYNLFHTPDFNSTSFLDAIRINQLKKSDMNPEAITDFIITTASMGWRTVFNGIIKVKFDDIIIDDGKKIKFEKKKIEDVFLIKKFDKSIIEQFSPITESLKQVKGKICIDLTGGFDSRMITTIFKHYGLEFETGISGIPGSPDVELSKKIAERLGVKHNITYHEVDAKRIEKEIDDAFLEFDACMDIVIWNRGYQFQKNKIKNNCVLNITGHAGELYKPVFIWSWNHNDPKQAINQLISKGTGFRYGFKFSTIPYNIFSKEYQKFSISYKNRIRNTLLDLYGNDKSGKILPKIYYYFMECGRSTTLTLIDRYSPLLDREVVPCGIILTGGISETKKDMIRLILRRPWNDRFLFERKVTTFLNKKVAKVRIADAMDYSASSTMYQQFKGNFNHHILRYFIKKKKKVSDIHPDFYPTVRSLNKTEEMIEILKNEDILKKNVSVEDIDDLYIGSLITIGKIIEFCE